MTAFAYEQAFAVRFPCTNEAIFPRFLIELDLSPNDSIACVAQRVSLDKRWNAQHSGFKTLLDIVRSIAQVKQKRSRLPNITPSNLTLGGRIQLLFDGRPQSWKLVLQHRPAPFSSRITVQQRESLAHKADRRGRDQERENLHHQIIRKQFQHLQFLPLASSSRFSIASPFQKEFHFFSQIIIFLVHLHFNSTLLPCTREKPRRQSTGKADPPCLQFFQSNKSVQVQSTDNCNNLAYHDMISFHFRPTKQRFRSKIDNT